MYCRQIPCNSFPGIEMTRTQCYYGNLLLCTNCANTGILLYVSYIHHVLYVLLNCDLQRAWQSYLIISLYMYSKDWIHIRIHHLLSHDGFFHFFKICNAICVNNCFYCSHMGNVYYSENSRFCCKYAVKNIYERKILCTLTWICVFRFFRIIIISHTKAYQSGQHDHIWATRLDCR